ncbi:MAG: cell division ATP-binding protein FtsE [Deltaproteobacteria bacterium]|nr:cell division ATP-binding protein FtsE [Deltaproteobacteria bacterium]
MVELIRVTKDYEKSPKALCDISLQVEKGKFLFLTGSSGAGKTTLLKLLYAAERPTAGEIRVNGFEVHRLKGREVPRLRRGLGVVFQDIKLLARRTALENVAFALEVLGLKGWEMRKKAVRALRQVGLEHRGGCYPAQLSAGEQQRVAIARAIVNEPPLILADEPTGNIDPAAAEGILRLFDEINLRGATVVLATHDPLLPKLLPRERISLVQGHIGDEPWGPKDQPGSSCSEDIFSARPGKT